MVNPDHVKEQLPEYQHLKDMGHSDIAAAKMHEESSHIAAEIAKAAMKGRRHMIVDGVGNSGSRKFVGKLEAAKAAGHRVTVRYAHTPLDVALKRDAARAEKTGRDVPDDVLEHAHKEVATRYHDATGEQRPVTAAAQTVVVERIWIETRTRIVRVARRRRRGGRR
jgi:predicted ABC-type ATPase